MNESRRRYLINSLIMLAFVPLRKARSLAPLITPSVLGDPHNGNFGHIYLNNELKNRFYHFLENVFHLYPEKELHQLIEATTQQLRIDQQIYTKVQDGLPLIKPFLADFRYSLPALKKQKEEMVKQTVTLLNGKTSFQNYIEVGSNGRYYDLLEEKVSLTGNIYFMSDVSPTYSPVDIIDRGQISNPAQHILLDNYQPDFHKIPAQSIELMTVYIGLHHCSLENRHSFFSGLSNLLKKEAILILRDHDVYNEDQHKIVCLAHDVFNMGTKISWENNQNELRHFYSLDVIIEKLKEYGLVFNGKKLYQDGDPTKNVLMSFTKI